MADNLLSYSLVKFGVDGDGRLKLVVHKKIWAILSSAMAEKSFEEIGEHAHINLQGLSKTDLIQYIESLPITQNPPCPPLNPGGNE